MANDELTLDSYKTGGNTWEDAMTLALADVPTASSFGADSSRRYGGTRIILADPAVEYEFSDYPLPQNKLIEICAEGPLGGKIVSSGNVAFLVEDGFSEKVFRNLAFDGCGVNLEGDSRGRFLFDACLFDSTADYAIETLGTGVVGVEISNCYFNRCTGAVGVMYNASDNWLIHNNTRIIRSDGAVAAIRTNTPGVHIESVRFENTSNVGVPAFIQIGTNGAYAGGHTSIVNCRFGGEEGATGQGSPQQMIIFGDDAESTGTMSNIRMMYNDFRNPQGTTRSRYDAIAVNKMINQSTLVGNVFGADYDSLVKYNNAGGLMTISNLRDVYWVGNSYDSNTQSTICDIDITTGDYADLDLGNPFRLVL